MNPLDDIILQIELHAVEGIRQCFTRGVSPNSLFRNEPLIFELISEYTRSPAFKHCVKAFVEAGLRLDDEALLAVLLDDAATLQAILLQRPAAVSERYSMRCAYTPFQEVTLLHICAEFNHCSAARVLVANGAEVNAKAGVDAFGFGGHTPIFHTVNQNGNQSADMMEYLLTQSADLTTSVTGLIWGKGCAWETFIPSVNPVSYAMMGLLPQMHRQEKTVASVISTLLKHAYAIDYTPGNIPNAYLSK